MTIRNIAHAAFLSIPLFVALVAGEFARTQDFCDDFVDNDDPLDGTPVRYAEPCWGPWQCTPTLEGLDCLRQPDPFTWGFFIADTDEVFAGDIVARARVSKRGVDTGFSISAHASFDCPVFTGYEGVVKRNGVLELRRWDRLAPDPRPPVLTAVGPIVPPVDLSDPDLQLEMELWIIGDRVEFRVWDAEEDRPAEPQVLLIDNEHRSGRCSINFGNLPTDAAPFRIYSFCVSELPSPPPPVRFIRSDANADDKTDLNDAVFVLNYLFLGGTAPSCKDAADCDDSGVLDISDPVYLLNYLFLGGPAPQTPFPECGPDPTIDKLTCGAFVGCDDT